MEHSALSDIRKLAPLIAKHADEAERERRLSRPVVDGLVEAGIFKLLTPRALGGAGASPMEFCEVIEAVSAIDGSTGWCVMIGGGFGQFAGLLSAAAAQEIFGPPSTVVSGTFRPVGMAQLAPGGYLVNGQAFGERLLACDVARSGLPRGGGRPAAAVCSGTAGAAAGIPAGGLRDNC